MLRDSENYNLRNEFVLYAPNLGQSSNLFRGRFSTEEPRETDYQAFDAFGVYFDCMRSRYGRGRVADPALTREHIFDTLDRWGDNFERYREDRSAALQPLLYASVSIAAPTLVYFLLMLGSLLLSRLGPYFAPLARTVLYRLQYEGKSFFWTGAVVISAFAFVAETIRRAFEIVGGG